MYADYFANHFPAEAVVKFYHPAAGSPTGREFSFGSYWKHFAAPDAATLRATLTKYAKEGSDDMRYDVGPVFSDPYTLACIHRSAQSSRKHVASRIVYSEFRVDIDVTDYKEARAACGCGDAKDRICERCWLVCRATCDAVDFNLQYYFSDPKSSITWAFTGGRGLHAWVRGPEGGESSVFARRALTRAMQKCSLDSAWQTRLRESHMPVPPTIKLDENVTASIKHLTRGLFSPHMARSLIDTPVTREQICQMDLKTLIETQIPSVPQLVKETSPDDPHHRMLTAATDRLQRK